MASFGAPAFRLYLLRHAHAGWAQPGQSDFDRTLDDDGFAEAEVIAEEAADQGYRPGLILASTAMRCRQTAEPFHRTVSEDLSIDYVDALYSGSVDTYAELAFAGRQESAVMIVGHNPMVEEFFHRLVGKEIAGATWRAGGGMSQFAAVVGVYGLSLVTVGATAAPRPAPQAATGSATVASFRASVRASRMPCDAPFDPIG